MSEPMIEMEHRESLAFALSEAAELEHGLMCCYLYAAFSLGKRTEQRHPPAQAQVIARWRAEIIDVARDEMVHMALVSNLLNAVGAAPHLTRPNFPVSAGYHPAGILVSLAPFSLATVQHFIYLERPDDVAGVTAEVEGRGFTGQAYARGGVGGRLVPSGQDYATVGHLYRWIRDGLGHLEDRFGADRVFCGDPRLQVTTAKIGLPGVTAVTDLASARRAIETIVTQGEGAPTCPGHSHYSRFSAMRDELKQILEADPGFAPARHVAYNPVMRRPPVADGLTWIDAEPAASVLDVANAMYAVMLRSLGALYSPVAIADDARALAIEATTASMRALTPIAELLTELPGSTADPQIRAGMTFTMSRSLHPLPEPRDALRALYEGVGAVAQAIRRHVVSLDASQAASAARLDDLAQRLRDASLRAPMPGLAVAVPAAAPVALRAPVDDKPGVVEQAVGDKLVLQSEGKRCIHARHCVLGAPRVFLANVKGPWLHPDEMDVEQLAHTVQMCPSGSLTYRRLDGGPEEPAPEVNELRLRENGPYALRASVDLVGHGALLRATLCRCGASQNKPFCDGSHNAIHFTATGEPASHESQPLAQRGGRLELRPEVDGPLVVTGNVEICGGTGRTIDRVTATRLCRCGGSSTKPFCDGTHAKIGFRSEPTGA